MPVAETIRSVRVKGEFRTCPVCGYDQGFQVSFQREPGQPARIVLICSECGARYDVGWEIHLPES